jgi:hypothetical protein
MWADEERNFRDQVGVNCRSQLKREGLLRRSVNKLIANHLGRLKPPTLLESTNYAANQALEYFDGTWWRGTDQARYLDKTFPAEEKTLIWLDPMCDGMYLCALLDRWDDVAKLAEWIDASLSPENRFELTDDAYSVFFMYLGSKLRSVPLVREAEMPDFIRKSKSRKAKLLLPLLDAALSKSQKDFDKAMVAALKHYEKYEVEDVANFHYWVAIPHSLVWLIAQRNGLTFPTLPPNLDALIVRRETALEGLDMP